MKNERSEIILLLTLLLLFSFGVNLLVRASQQPPAPLPAAIGTPIVLPIVPVEEPMSKVGLPAGSTTAAPISVQPRAPQPAVPLAPVGPSGQVMVPTFVPAPLAAGQSIPMSSTAMSPVVTPVPVSTPMPAAPAIPFVPAQTPVQALPVASVVPVVAVPVTAPAVQGASAKVPTTTTGAQPAVAVPAAAPVAEVQPVVQQEPLPTEQPAAPEQPEPEAQQTTTPSETAAPQTAPQPTVEKKEKQKSQKEEAQLSIGEGDLAALPADKIIDFFKYNIAAGNDDVIVRAMRNLPIEKAREFVREVAQANLQRPMKLQIIFGLANYYPDQEQKFSLFNLAVPLIMADDVPALSIAAQSIYPMIIPDIVAWMKIKNIINTNEAIKDALVYSIKKNGLEALKKFQEHTKLLSGDRATELMWDALDHRAKAFIVQFLIDQNADLNTTRNGDTLLVRAVKQLNLPAVKAIVESAENNKFEMNKFMNRFADPEHDTPLQAATKIQINPNRSRKNKRRAVAIEEYLRAHGASENL